MKILIVSDTHRHNDILKKVIDRTSPIDLLIHLGDSEGTDEAIREMAGCPVLIVAGNNDFFSGLKKEISTVIGKYRIFLTHGHQHNLSSGYESLIKSSNGADIIMFGHTHKPLIFMKNGIVVLNPGSVSYPRQEGRLPSYIIMELDKNGEAHFNLNYLENF